MLKSEMQNYFPPLKQPIKKNSIQIFLVLMGFEDSTG